MRGLTEVPFPPRPSVPQGAPMEPPWVPIEPEWEYKEVERDLATGTLPSAEELNALGAEHWELVGVVSAAGRVHFYFKRERVR